MIIRIVKMTFHVDRIEEVKKFLSLVRDKIQNFPGCHYLDILQDLDNRNVFFSYSLWDSDQDLYNYRNSDFFKQTWSTAKKWFSEKPLAWSLTKLDDSNESTR